MRSFAQVDAKFGEYNSNSTVRKEIRIERTASTTFQAVNIYIDEYQLYNLSFIYKCPCIKRRFLCRTTYYFFEEVEEDYIQGNCSVTKQFCL